MALRSTTRRSAMLMVMARSGWGAAARAAMRSSGVVRLVVRMVPAVHVGRGCEVEVACPGSSVEQDGGDEVAEVALLAEDGAVHVDDHGRPPGGSGPPEGGPVGDDGAFADEEFGAFLADDGHPVEAAASGEGGDRRYRE